MVTSQTEPAPDPGKEKKYTHTAGIDFSRADVPGVGKLNIIDMAGQSEYFPTHCLFMIGSDDTITALLYKGIDFNKDGIVIRPKDVKGSAMKDVKQMIQMMISTNKGCSSKDTSKRMMYVYLVATRGDWAEMYGYGNEVRKLARQVIDEAAKMFSEHIGIFIGDEILVLNTHDPQSPDMKKLREIIRMKKEEVNKNLKPMPAICGKIMELVTQWKKQQKLFPVLYWDDYLARVRKGIDPNLEEDYIKKATEHLHTVTELQYIKCSKTPESQDVIIIDAQWFGVRILGPMFATRIFDQYADKLETKEIYPVEDIKQVLGGKAHMDKLIQLLIDMEIIFPLGDKDYGGGHAGQFIIPNILPHIMPEEQWMMSQHINIYYGRRFICQREHDIFSPSFFPKLQARLHVSFTKLGRPPSGIWKNGIKVCKGVEALVFLSDDIWDREWKSCLLYTSNNAEEQKWLPTILYLSARDLKANLHYTSSNTAEQTEMATLYCTHVAVWKSSLHYIGNNAAEQKWLPYTVLPCKRLEIKSILHQ
ncbi:death-associated protein kinase dapk-1-like [Saccoglossus kowalevskii]